MAEGNERGGVVSDASWKEEASPDHRPSKKKLRCSPPDIDRHLQMKWGLALLGEEKSREYLAWLREKLGQAAQQ
jgi:hypothetical protein